MDLHQLGFVVVYEYEEVSSLIFTWFYSEIWSRVFRNLWIWFCLLIFGLKSRNKPVILSLFFSKSCLRDRTEFVTTGDEFGARIAEEVIQWWRFNIESLRIATNFTEFGLDLVLEIARVYASFWILVIFWVWMDFDRNWKERESSELFVWRGLNFVVLLLTRTVPGLL